MGARLSTQLPAKPGWVKTADRLPPDAEAVVWWDKVRGLVCGYRFGSPGRPGLWVIPGAAPVYCAVPDEWRYPTNPKE